MPQPINSKPRLAVDFDGVIHKYSQGWKDGLIYDEPVVGSKETLAKIGEKYQIVIFSTRLNPEVNPDDHNQELMVQEWLDKNGFVKGVHYHEMTGKKPLAKIYLDDRALKFTSWKSAEKVILNTN